MDSANTFDLCIRSSSSTPAMSGQPPPQPQPFRFWLPYRSNVGSSRQQPRPSSGTALAQPATPRPQPPPPPPPPPTPAERPPRAPLAQAMEEDIPVQGESSDESDTIPVQSLDSPRWRGARRPSVPDLELRLSRSPRAGQEQSPRGGDGGGGSGNDTKISISGFPRSRLFDGSRAPYRREIEDGLKSLAGREAPTARADSGQGYRVITLTGHNVVASMVLGGGGAREHAPSPRAAEQEKSPSRPPPAAAANVNSNVQSVNNSSMEASTCNAGDPGVRVDIKNARDEPVVVAPPKNQQEEEKPKEPARRPPLAVPAPQPENREAARPARARRCLRALMMKSWSDTEPAPKPSACRFQCLADHKPPTATTSNGGGVGDGKSGEEGGKENTS